MGPSFVESEKYPTESASQHGIQNKCRKALPLTIKFGWPGTVMTVVGARAPSFLPRARLISGFDLTWLGGGWYRLPEGVTSQRNMGSMEVRKYTPMLCSRGRRLEDLDFLGTHCLRPSLPKIGNMLRVSFAALCSGLAKYWG